MKHKGIVSHLSEEKSDVAPKSVPMSLFEHKTPLLLGGRPSIVFIFFFVMSNFFFAFKFPLLFSGFVLSKQKP